MNSHEIAKELLSMPPKDVVISVDISTNDSSSGNRAFGTEYMGINDVDDDNEVVLLFSGHVNT